MEYVFHFHSIWVNKHLFISGAFITLQIAVLGMVIGLILGTAGAVCRKSQNTFLRSISSIYVEIVRNTPLLVQLYLWYFGLGALRINLSPFLCIVIALGVNTGGYSTEIIRAGMEAIREEQKRAGYSLGMSRIQTFRYIVMIPSIGIVFPALCNQLLICILASALGMIIGVKDLTYEAVYLQAHTFRAIETFMVVVVIYIVLSKAILLFSDFLDKKIFKYKHI